MACIKIIFGDIEQKKLFFKKVDLAKNVRDFFP